MDGAVVGGDGEGKEGVDEGEVIGGGGVPSYLPAHRAARFGEQGL